MTVHRERERMIHSFTDANLLWSTEEEIKITKFDSNPLAGFSDELICARHIFWIGTWIRWWDEKTCTFMCKVDYIGTWRTRNGLSDIVLGCFEDESKKLLVFEEQTGTKFLSLTFINKLIAAFKDVRHRFVFRAEEGQSYSPI